MELSNDIIGKCGDRCNYCPRYIATKNGDINELKKVAELWQKTGIRARVVSSEEISCLGCTPDNNCFYGINKCAFDKKVENCGRCSQFECDIIKNAFITNDSLKGACKNKLSESEFEQLNDAFFRKKEVLYSQKK